MKKIYPIIILFIFFVLTACNTNKNQKHDANPEPETQVESSQSNTILKGKIVKVTFVDKGGREHRDIYDLYLKTGGEKLFIKFSDSKVSREEIEKYIDKPITVEVEITEDGLWDTDDPNVQSRIGKYIAVLEIK